MNQTSECPNLDFAPFVGETILLLLMAITVVVGHLLVTVALKKARVFHPHVTNALWLNSLAGFAKALYMIEATVFNIYLLFTNSTNTDYGRALRFRAPFEI